MVQLYKYQPKDLIFREGEEGKAAYIIHQGQVEILKHAEHGEVQLAVLERGDVFGEMALFEPRNTRSASARALTELQVEIITDEQFSEILKTIPTSVKTMVMALNTRLRDTNQRLAQKERATVVLGGAIDKITISAATDALHFAPLTIMAANLPFTIGGYAKSESPPNLNHMELPCDGPPLMISQKHLLIERRGTEVFVVDTGSRHCTIVNGKVIGRGKLEGSAQLQLGENKITLGDYTSAYRLVMFCE